MTTTQERDDDGLPIIRHLHVQHEWLRCVQEQVLEPELPIIDPHHHLWEREGGYLLDELLADITAGHNVIGTVFAQCGYAYRTDGPEPLRPVGETEFVAKLARRADEREVKPRVCSGIVAYADMELGNDVAAVLEAHVAAGDGRLRGIRHIAGRHDAFNASLLGRPPRDLLQRPAFRRGLTRLQAMGLTFDAALYHTQINELADLAHAMPNLSIVMNHFGGPLGVGPYAGRRDAMLTEWRASMKSLSACPNVYVKMGGLAVGSAGYKYHEQPLPPSSQELAAAWKPYVETSVELFGPRRCMFESNFPVDKAQCSYVVIWNAFKRMLSGASVDEKAWLFAGTANTFYRLGLE